MTISTGTDDAIESFIDLHLPISEKSLALARDFLLTLFEPGAPEQALARDRRLVDVLEEVVLATDAAYPGRKVVIPLTAGLDSRGLLGAALRVLDRKRIFCITVGEERNAEVVAAREVCRRLGIDHATVYPDAFSWDHDLILARARESHARNAAFCSIEGPMFAMIRDACRRRFGGDYYTLSGFLGDVCSGGNLRAPAMAESMGQAVEQFLVFNRTRPSYFGGDRLREAIAGFGESVSHELRARGYAEVTPFDALDLGLRQGLRIRGGLLVGDNLHCPYADARLLAWWFGQVPRKRRGQERYRQELGERYPEVFCLKNDKLRQKPPIRRSRRSLYARALGALRSRLGFARNSTERGNLRSNVEKRELLAGFVQSFADRGLTDRDFASVLDSFRARPMGPAQRYVKAIATAELHLRAGTIDPVLDAGERPAA